MDLFLKHPNAFQLLRHKHDMMNKKNATHAYFKLLAKIGDGTTENGPPKKRCNLKSPHGDSERLRPPPRLSRLPLGRPSLGSS